MCEIIALNLKEQDQFSFCSIDKKTFNMEKARPIKIVDIDNHVYTLNEELLIKVLNNPEIRNRKIAVISVAGAFRKGKSFLLGFFLRYLYAQVCSLLIIYK